MAPALVVAFVFSYSFFWLIAQGFNAWEIFFGMRQFATLRAFLGDFWCGGAGVVAEGRDHADAVTVEPVRTSQARWDGESATRKDGPMWKLSVPGEEEPVGCWVEVWCSGFR